MESVLSRYRNLIILVGVLFLQVLGLAMQVKRANNEAQDTRLIRIWAVGTLAPFERGLVWIQNSTGNLWHNYIYLRGVRAENRELKEQIEQMRLEQVRLNQDATQAHRLQTLLAFKEQYVAKTIAAQVIGSSGSDLSRVIYIDKGENEGIARDMAVITADGIVGKVLMVYPSVSQVLLINDQSSGVGAILEKSRLQGVLRGSANGEVMLERVMSDEQVTPGETVLTSGGDQIFPKGLPVGTVMTVGNGRDLFLNIRIKPAADLSKLEEVLVLVQQQERQATAEDKTRVRAADILAQRLPSVPDKPAVDANASSASRTATSPKTATANPAPKPKNLLPPSASQSAKNPTTGVQTAPGKPLAAVAGGRAKQDAASEPITIAKPASPTPSITEQNKPAAPAAAPATQPASPPDDSPH
ncbi:MAG TPA: rod shape-determining protein MreC [Candidatus Sulfotelmatobacter sp.]|nr:rod shape-determining protein MreC [Candidatus Sulfotelmatobacter sp.]